MPAEDRGESKAPGTASLINEAPLPKHERLVFDRLRHDESSQLDELIEQLELELGSAEIFTASFEQELAGVAAAVSRKKLCAGILMCTSVARFPR